MSLQNQLVNIKMAILIKKNLLAPSVFVFRQK